MAAIATILTANIAIISTQRANAARAQEVLVPSTTSLPAAKPAFVLYGTADTPFAMPTVFAVRGDGNDLWPSSHLPVRTDQVLDGRVSPVDTPSARVVRGHSMVAFLDATGAIAFADPTGMVVRVLPAPPAFAFSAFGISPDGERIGVVRRTRTSTNESPALFVMDMLGQEVRLIARGDFRSVDWSHDGTRLAVVRSDGESDALWVYDVHDRTGLQITAGTTTTATFCGRTASVRPRATQPMWSLDDRQIAFLSNADHLQSLGRTFDVKVANADGGGGDVTAHRTPGDVCERIDGSSSLIRMVEYVSLFGWAKSANMAA